LYNITSYDIILHIKQKCKINKDKFFRKRVIINE